MESCAIDFAISSLVNFGIVYDPASKAWRFKRFIFEIEASYSFKITFIMLKQVISLKKNGGVISKSYCLISWSPI